MKTINQAAVTAVETIKTIIGTVEHKAMNFECGAISVPTQNIAQVRDILKEYPGVLVTQEMEFFDSTVVSYYGPNSMTLMQTRLVEITIELGSEELAALVAKGNGEEAKELLEAGTRLDLLAVGLASGVIVSAESEGDFSVVNQEGFFEILEESMKVQYPHVTGEQANTVMGNTKTMINDWVAKLAA